MADQRQSDECDFGRLFVQHEARIYGYIRSLVVHRADAEDLLQETASMLWQKFHEFQPGSNFLAWAMSVARFQCSTSAGKRNTTCSNLARRSKTSWRPTPWPSRRGWTIYSSCLTNVYTSYRRLIAICLPSAMPRKLRPPSLADRLGRPARPFTVPFVVFAGLWPTA